MDVDVQIPLEISHQVIGCHLAWRKTPNLVHIGKFNNVQTPVPRGLHVQRPFFTWYGSNRHQMVSVKAFCQARFRWYNPFPRSSVKSSSGVDCNIDLNFDLISLNS